MDIQVINYVLKLLKDAMEWVQELYRTVQQYGTQPALFDLTGHPAFPLNTDEDSFRREQIRELDDEAIRIAYRRMLNRNRVRRHRERKKQQLLAAADGKAATATGNSENITKAEETASNPANTITHNAKCITGNAKTVTCNAETTECNDSETPGNALAKNEKESKKRKNQRKEVNKKQKIKTPIADAMPNSARPHAGKRAAAEETDLFAEAGLAAMEPKQETNTGTGEENSLPVQPQEKKTSKLIPTNDLSEMHQKVVLAWNKLPLPKKLKGLFPSMVKQLNELFENYGEEAVHEAIGRVADSPFLLGKSKNNRGWVANLYWLLQPENLEKILSGKYQDDGPRGNRDDDASPCVPEGFYGTVVY